MMSYQPKLNLFVVTIMLGSLFVATDDANGQRGRGGGWGRDSGMGILNDEKVQQELDLVDDQLEQIEDLQQEQREAMQEMFSGMRDKFRDMDRDSRETAMEEIREKMQSLRTEYDDKARDVLLPHQVTRWEQLQFQTKAQQAGGAERFLASDTVAEKLNITDEQMEKLKAKAEEVRASVLEKVAKIREDAQNEILSVLTPEQREQYKQLAGDAFAFDNNRDRGAGRGGRGGDGGGRDGAGRGGRGGDGGGRGRGGDGGGRRGGRGGDGGNGGGDADERT